MIQHHQVSEAQQAYDLFWPKVDFCNMRVQTVCIIALHVQKVKFCNMRVQNVCISALHVQKVQFCNMRFQNVCISAFRRYSFATCAFKCVHQCTARTEGTVKSTLRTDGSTVNVKCAARTHGLVQGAPERQIYVYCAVQRYNLV